MMGQQRFLLSSLCVFFLSLTCGQSLNVRLSHVSTLYVPTYDAHGTISYGLLTGTIEQLSFDRDAKLIYGVGNGVIHVIGASDVTRLTYVDHFLLPELDLTDVKVCGDGVFVSYRNKSDLLSGGVRVYRRYNTATIQFELLHDIPMGSHPDMISPVPTDCTIVVAVENNGVVINGVLHDPPGGVGIIRFPTGIEGLPVSKLLDFSKFNSQFTTLAQSGVRWIYRGNQNHFSNNIEPEYVTFNDNYKTAYIGLQENNAIATVDLTTDEIVSIKGLGFKQWGQLDPSDQDGGIHIQSWPIYGIYAPDAIHYVKWGGEGYIISANEGDSMAYNVQGHANDFDEEIRGHSIHAADIANSVSPNLVSALADTTKLGRLVFSSVDGKDSAGKYEKFYTYGGRSFSIWRASDMKQVYDSGSEIEQRTSLLRPDLFNNDVDPANTVLERMDKRSDAKGPEPESIAVAEMSGHLVIFVGIERPGMVGVYTLPPNGTMTPEFQSLYSAGIPKDGRTYQQMFDARSVHGMDPEYLQFFDPSEGLADYPVLLVAGTVSGTISILRVETGDGPIIG